ncbi:MAG: xanthine dehydrogenase accessory protein XdhC [Rubrivivax sp.]
MTEDRLRAIALQWRAEARPAVVVQVTASLGSVPRTAGTRMLIATDTAHGTIGGGHLEWQAMAQARRLLAGEPVARERHLALGPALGQCCGGVLDLRLTSLADDDPTRWPAEPPLFDLQLYGAGHVGRAIVRLLVDLPCRVSWIDEREVAFDADAGAPLVAAPHIRRICTEAVEAEVASAAPGAFYLVLTHRHDLDLAIVQAILARGDAGFVGLIGSRTKRARFENRLRGRHGFDDARLATLVCPIGLQGISGKAPPVIALAVVAQLLQQATR